MFTSTPVSTDSKILEHFDQLRTLISGFLQQKSDRQPFFDYVASEAEKMTQEEFEDLKGRESGYCQQPLNSLLPPEQQLAAVTSTTHPAHLALATLHQF